MEIFAPYSLHRSRNKNVRRITEFWVRGFSFKNNRDFLEGIPLDIALIFYKELDQEYLEHCRINEPCLGK